MCHVSKAGLNMIESRAKNMFISSTETGLMTFKAINFMLAENRMAYSNFLLQFGVIFMVKSCHFWSFREAGH